MTLEQYIDNLDKRYRLGNATEHTFRGDLQQLLESLVPTIRATNEPKRQKCGAPDYILTKKDIPVGFIEAKDIGDKDLDGVKKTGNKEQFDRYKASLNNLIFTDYINFHLYQEGEFITKISIAEITDKGIRPLPEHFGNFENLIKDFCVHVGQTIKSSKKLAGMMAGKARLLSDIIEKSLTSDEENQENSTLKEQMLAFKQILIHDITPQGFADVYAQTIAYGMFAARLHDPTLNNFSRQEAAELIPKSNPFLRKLFGYIAGPDIDDRIKWVVENLSEIFLACNVEEILKNYGKSTKMEDPIIHFYETFLSEYDPKLRKSRGVWYTPQPVVDFIVRAVDDILKTEFDLPQGLADTSKTTIKVNTQTADKRSATGYKQMEQEVHKVQILDPATGTGTFLAEVVKHIHKKFQGQQGIWSNYVETHLLPRLNGFELLMASYAMAHLKLDLLLTETGFKPTVTSSGVEKHQRLRVYLTNSLEEHHQDTGTLFANWLSTEANEANHIKRDTPVMCVIGNPPYSGISSNNGEWISNLIEDYKYVDGVHFNERKHWLNDDYVKFLRYGQNFIEKNGSGVLAFINPHGYLDNPTFRGMRWHLLKTYDKIYAIDLHGNSKKKETAPDGSADINVFDIQQGVSINIFVKTGKKKANELGEVLHYDLYGKREMKYDFLAENSIKTVDFIKLKPEDPFYFFIQKNKEGLKEYNNGFKIDELFPLNVTGVVTARDSVVVDFNAQSLIDRIQRFTSREFSDSETRSWLFPKKKNGKYLAGDSRGWKLVEAREKIANNHHQEFIKNYDYRPFDTRKIYYSSDMVDWGREKYMYNIITGVNLNLITARQSTDVNWSLVQITENMIDNRYHFSYKGIPSQFPLYVYAVSDGQQTIDQSTERKPNLKAEIVNKIAEKLGLAFTNEPLVSAQGSPKTTFAPIDLLDYIYAVLHSPTYREKYKEFLKIDFPRVPYPKDQATFWQLVKLGGEIRQIHLLESPKVEQYITQYPVDGDNIITRKMSKTSPGYVPSVTSSAVEKPQMGRVYINDTQYFDNVPLVAWEFYIGGYQPAQKWLKDRKDRKLEFDDILHYQKVLVALSETDRLMKEIDKIGIE
ncbi:type ISP restriction/modification enzyme [Maribacter sp. 2307ULW6-5]|uniref:type ISP restriction/modification enzyme n=1 Tax=Maribacter sp. 2307ULW6-5 TaxID=3386275 RepID=UPI0039BD685B